MRLVRKELKVDRNGWKPFSAALPAVPVPIALHDILLDLRKFESPITVCYADMGDESTTDVRH